MMAEICINPAEIREGDLMAFLDAIADERVVQHVHSCSACFQRTQELAELQATLTTKFYRHSCPTAEKLAAFQQSELRGNEHLVVSQHVRQCPHCAQELAILAIKERATVSDWIRTVVKRIEAIPLTPRTELADLRSHPEATASSVQIYQADSMDVIVRLQPSLVHKQEWDLSGVVHIGGQVPDTIEAGKVELYQGSGLIAISHISSRGQFSFTALEKGSYDLALVWSDREIVVRGVQVG